MAALVALVAVPLLTNDERTTTAQERPIAPPAPVLATPPESQPLQSTPTVSSPVLVPPIAAPAAPAAPAKVAEARKPVVQQTSTAAPARARAVASGEDGPAFHCDWRLRPSEQMVCDDPELARLDRRLNAAFSRAVAAGVARAALRAEQDAWVWERERAAQDSRQAVEDLYRERIQALNELADSTG